MEPLYRFAKVLARWFLGCAVLSMFLALGVFAADRDERTVEFVKSVDFMKQTGKKSIGSFLLGKKKQDAVKPGSLCIVGNLLCVTDAMNGTVLIIDKNGKIKKKMTRFKGGRFISPVSCCTDNNGNLYVSDSALSAILKFDDKLKFEKIFVSYPGGRITGIVYLKGFFYILDTANHRVLRFNGNGTLTHAFGQRGNGNGEFNFPTHITADGKYIYITDAMNFRVQVFDGEGKYIRRFGKIGRGGGNFSKPKGITVDNNRRVYVADAMFDNVQIFNQNGEFLYYFGGPGHGNGEFWMPSDVMVDEDDFIWVADTFNSRIQVFKLTGEEQ